MVSETSAHHNRKSMAAAMVWLMGWLRTSGQLQEAESRTKARLGYHLQSLTPSDLSITTKPCLLKGFTTSKTAAPAGDQLLKCKSLGAHGHSHQNILAKRILSPGVILIRNHFGCRRDGLTGKNTSSYYVQTWVQIPSTHKKSPTWLCLPITLALGGRDKWSLGTQQLSILT